MSKRIGMGDETARRRLTVEDLQKAGLSVRMISSVTGIPRSSVHRAMRAIARAEAKKQIAIAKMAQDLLSQRPSSWRPRPTMTKSVMTKAPRAACTSAGALGRFLADVTCAWELYGKETLERMAIEQPLMFFETMIDLIVSRTENSANIGMLRLSAISTSMRTTSLRFRTWRFLLVDRQAISARPQRSGLSPRTRHRE